MMILNNATAAFLIGIGWSLIVFVYGKFLNMGIFPRYEGTIRSAIGSGFDIAFVGGGSGVVIYIVESHLSATRYGLAGMVFAFVTATIAGKFR